MCVCIRLYVRCLYAQPRYSHAAHPLGGSVANLLGRVGVSVLPPRRVSLLYGTFLPLSLTLPWTVCCDGRTSSALCAFEKIFAGVFWRARAVALVFERP